MGEINDRRYTGRNDINGAKIHEGDRIRGESIEGEMLDYRVKWSEYHGFWIGDNSGEIYDVGEKRFHEFEVIKEQQD